MKKLKIDLATYLRLRSLFPSEAELATTTYQETGRKVVVIVLDVKIGDRHLSNTREVTDYQLARWDQEKTVAYCKVLLRDMAEELAAMLIEPDVVLTKAETPAPVGQETQP